MIGTTISHYKILEKLGEGGMGIVYKAQDLKLDRTVALKFLPPHLASDEQDKKRFIHEAKAASSLDHPNICNVHEIDETPDGQVFIVMAIYEGTPLNKKIEKGPLKIDEALDVVIQVAEGLQAAHEKGITHRDIKSSNIILTDKGRSVIMDFGLARTTGVTRLTKTGATVGTVSYMSPEQARGEKVDNRTDIWSLGVVLYEMLTGQLPFTGKYEQVVLYRVMNEQPERIHKLRSGILPEFEQIVEKALEKKLEKRYQHTEDVLKDLKALREQVVSKVGVLRPKHRMVTPILVTVIIVILGVGAWLWWRQSRATWARTVALPEAAQLIEEGKTYAAFRLLRQAEAYVPDDAVLRDLLSESTTEVTIRTEPEGAQVYIRDFFDEADAWERLGSAPLDGVRLPASSLVFKVSHEGFETRQLVAYGAVYTPGRTLDFSLQPIADTPAGMVHVPGGRYELFSLPAVGLDNYWIDKYEVTNRQFKEFVDRGGDERREYWTEPFVKDGKTLSWDEARQVFRDRTGRPGPATWELGTYPDGEDDYPVGGVSWYEAAAYCASVGKQLPTIYHWYQAANLVGVTQFAQFGNFQADGPTKVGHVLRIGFYGTYDMAGNVKEWVWNQADPNRRYILGGAWNEPSYQFYIHDAQRPFDRQPTYGFRCAKYPGPLAAVLVDRVEAPSRDYRRETPVGDEAFALYASLYRYDRTPLDGRVESVDDSSERWRIERVSFAAAYGNERVPAWLFLPKNARPPYQTVVYFPGAGPWWQRSSGGEPSGSYWFLFLVRSGRAVLVPVYKGMYERHAGSILLPHVLRDVLIDAGKDLGRALDYLETRADIDAQKLAYFGLSSGAGLGPIMTAVEPRFRASILLGGGLLFFRRPPESEVFNFLPRVKVPTLMINGRHDFIFPVETSQEPMFRLLGTPLADKRHRIFESGHMPTERQEVIKEILDWLDRYLGPVSRP